MNDKAQMQNNINLYRQALLAIANLAGDQVPTHEQIFAGISYYTQIAFVLLPNADLAQQTIDAGIEYGKTLVDPASSKEGENHEL